MRADNDTVNTRCKMIEFLRCSCPAVRKNAHLFGNVQQIYVHRRCKKIDILFRDINARSSFTPKLSKQGFSLWEINAKTALIRGFGIRRRFAVFRLAPRVGTVQETSKRDQS